MAGVCKVCRHPQRAQIEAGLLNHVSLRVLAQQTKPIISAWSIRRHGQHLPAQLVIAERAAEVSEASSLLERVEVLMQESERIAAAGKLEKNWPAAVGALREARGCLELLAKLRGELQQRGGDMHLHQHAHIHAGSLPKTEIEIDLEIAKHVAAATSNFNPLEIARLKQLAAGSDAHSLS